MPHQLCNYELCNTRLVSRSRGYAFGVCTYCFIAKRYVGKGGMSLDEYKALIERSKQPEYIKRVTISFKDTHRD